MPARQAWALGLLVLWLASAQGAEPATGHRTEPAKRAKPAEAAEPSMELLEFLGEWADDRGDVVDPQAMEHLQLPQQEQHHAQQHDQ